MTNPNTKDLEKGTMEEDITKCNNAIPKTLLNHLKYLLRQLTLRRRIKS